MTSVFIGQIIGYAASAASLTVFFAKKRKDMIALKLLSDVLWAIHHVLIGSFPAAATTLIAVGREYVFYVTAKSGKKNNVAPCFFMLLFALSAVITWKDVYSLFPALCSVTATAAFWNRNTQVIRALSFISSVFMLVYGLHYSSYATIFNEIVVELAIIFTFCTAKRSMRTDVSKNAQKD